ncbi:MAG TPA: CorA family divalent cation transporter [Pedococcus sp.]|jgi:Mg2+ and Co2+ transporter CorA|uniref:CorA family divalent cation transporter n=1 Tax=Pedococcus sp. TaxID=2860345 RepID=UPI002F920979
MRVSLVRPDGITDHAPAELESLLRRGDGFVWVDLPEVDEEAEAVLSGVFHAHPMVVRACRERTFVPTVHAYDEHVFIVVHAPLAGERGHVHSLELDQLVGVEYLVTVHGPRNPVVALEETTTETEQVRERIAAGRFHPADPAELSYAVVSAVARRQGAAVRAVANRLPALELRVMNSDFQRPEELLEELFLLRHELLVARTMAAQCHDIYARLANLDRVTTEQTRRLAADLREQFERTRSVADGESQFLFGVIELYQTRVTTKMTLAMERLAVIAAITLPVTAIASVYGMNVIVNDRTHVGQLVVVVVVMLGISLWLLRWARRQGWW